MPPLCPVTQCAALLARCVVLGRKVPPSERDYVALRAQYVPPRDAICPRFLQDLPTSRCNYMPPHRSMCGPIQSFRTTFLEVVTQHPWLWWAFRFTLRLNPTKLDTGIGIVNFTTFHTGLDLKHRFTMNNFYSLERFIHMLVQFNNFGADLLD